MDVCAIVFEVDVIKLYNLLVTITNYNKLAIRHELKINVDNFS